MTTLRPADFGPLGNAADDTAAMLALASAAQSGDVIEVDGHLRIDGEIGFSGHERLSLVGHGLVEQVSNYKKTLKFSDFGCIDVESVSFKGRGGAAGEFNGGSSSFNNVSALFFDGGDIVNIDKITCTDHAGGDVNFRNVSETSVHKSRFEGIGSTYIDPIDNGSDFAISAQSWTNQPMRLDYRHNWSDNVIKGHAFGVQAVGTKSFILHGNDISCEGQHGVYGIENDGINWTGNNFYGCPQLAMKMQLENYAGQFFGSPWAPGAFYLGGAERTYLGTLYVCISDHTASSSFVNDWKVDIRWKVSPKGIRKGGIIADNQAYSCGSVAGVISSTLSDGRDEYIDGLTIANNAGIDCKADGFVLDRCINLNMHGNIVEKAARYGMFFRDSCGRILDNRVNNSGWSGIFGSLSYDTEMRRNKLLDTGLKATTIYEQFPVYVSATVPATAIPSQASNPTIIFDANDIRCSASDCLSPQATFFDVRYKVDMTENRTNSVKPGRINGTKLRVRNNDFTSVI
jgi:hypothetical protein